MHQDRYRMLQITHSSQTRQQFAFSPFGIGGKHELQEDYREINGYSNRSLQTTLSKLGWVIGRNRTVGDSNPNKGSGSLEKSQNSTIRGYPAGVNRIEPNHGRYGDCFDRNPGWTCLP